MTPVTIKLHQRSATLELTYEDGLTHTLSAEYLRVHSPSAEVQGHSPDQAVLQHGKKNVTLIALEPQGNYAIKIVFSDGHDTGIYSWDYLFQLGTEQDQRWQTYLDALAKAGQSRDDSMIIKVR